MDRRCGPVFTIGCYLLSLFLEISIIIMIECVSDARFGLLIKYGLEFSSLFAGNILTRFICSTSLILISKHA